MSLEIVIEEPIAATPEGEYDATVVDVRLQDATHGQAVRFDFMLSDDEVDSRQVSGMASLRPSANTKLGRWIAAIMGRIPDVGERVTSGQLVQQECRVVIKHKAGADGQTFANVAQVLPLRKSAADPAG